MSPVHSYGTCTQPALVPNTKIELAHISPGYLRLNFRKSIEFKFVLLNSLKWNITIAYFEDEIQQTNSQNMLQFKIFMSSIQR